jgi:hypothetical protein
VAEAKRHNQIKEKPLELIESTAEPKDNSKQADVQKNGITQKTKTPSKPKPKRTIPSTIDSQGPISALNSRIFIQRVSKPILGVSKSFASQTYESLTPYKSLSKNLDSKPTP